MASTYKTNYLGLNKFVGSDKPKMDDFNFDNETLDQKFQEHVQSSLHITEEERQDGTGKELCDRNLYGKWRITQNY